MERLSSGFRINRAGDDAAGLAISEKMRGQIRGLKQASRNAQDGISLIQTAEGALNETHAILQRMRELAVQSATDTNVGIDRQAIQDEMNELVQEIDRISKTTEFNTQGLLDGSFDGRFQIGANEGQSVGLQINKIDTASLGLTSTNSAESKELTADSNLQDGIYVIDGTDLKDANGNVVGTLEGNKLTINEKETEFTKAKLADGAIIAVKDGTADVKNPMSGKALDLAAGSYEIKGTNLVKDNEIIGQVDISANTLTIEGVTVTAEELGILDDAFAEGAKFTINGSDVSSRDTASASVDSINKAIEQVSTERSKLGAMQNRLEHTISNLGTSAENLQAAESRIRDLDMAEEIMAFTKNNILQQATTAMLAQANMAPQSVLQLLG
jgi:flagellin